MASDKQLRAAEGRTEKADKEREKVPYGIVTPNFSKPLSKCFKSEKIPSALFSPLLAVYSESPRGL